MEIKPGDRINVSFTMHISEINLEVKADGDRLFVSMDLGLVYLDELEDFENAVVEPFDPNAYR